VETAKGYREAILKTGEVMERLAVAAACSRCAGTEAGGGCFEGVEAWFDQVLLYINLAMGVDLPDSQEIPEGCFFVGRKGCKLLAHHAFCINYLCPSLHRSLDPAQRGRLLAAAGEELLRGWELEKVIRRRLRVLGDSEPVIQTPCGDDDDLQPFISSVWPFEICCIRPPTENYSLTFRLIRNCYWKRCALCPIYKFKASFSKRGIEVVKEDIRRARQLEDLLLEEGIRPGPYLDRAHRRLLNLMKRIETAKGVARDGVKQKAEKVPHSLDPRLVWFLSWFKEKPNLEDNLNKLISWPMAGARTCFLGDADALVLRPEYLTHVIQRILSHFPTIERFTVYGRILTSARIRKLEEMRAYPEGGLDRFHLGLESGSDLVLWF